MLYERILVPLDGSELAQVALPYARELGGRMGSWITLMYVSESADDRYNDMHRQYMQDMVEATVQGAEKYVDKAGGRDVRVDAVIAVGNPAEQIVDYAESQNMGLIVMTTHGRSGVKRWALGSVADKVVRATRRPVALIRAKRVEAEVGTRGVFDRILVSLDGSRESEAVLPYVQELASRTGAEVALVQVVAPDYHIYGAGGPEYGTYADQQMESIKAYAKAYLEEIASGLKRAGMATRCIVSIGTAADEIIRLADEICADMVAMSTHGRSGVGRWALGSVAERVVRSGNTPVLLVRTPGAATE